ncbi:MAG TPA: hypothetical protein VES38_00480 [Methylotenera sp.]|nr:hypothetical protein [Methylotenera sp.]
MSHKLNLEFIRQPNFAFSNWNWLSVSVLCTGLMAAIVTEQTFQSKSIALEEVTSKLTKINREINDKKTPVATANISFSPLEIKQLEETVNSLTMPWNALLSQIEQSNQADIALLSLQPSTKKQMILLAGEAKNLPAVLSYIKQLEAQPMLAEVYLQKHSTNEGNVSKPIVFTIFAKWQLMGTPLLTAHLTAPRSAVQSK